MNTTIDKTALITELKTFGITDEAEINQALSIIGDLDGPSAPQVPLAQVEFGDGNPANPIAVYIKNLTNRSVAVNYSRAIDGKPPQFQDITLSPNERRYVGAHCITGSYTNLCSLNIYTTIHRARYAS